MGPLMDRYAIAHEQFHIAERFSDVAMANAEYLLAPRVRLVDAQQRLVRVVYAPASARLHPPRVPSLWYTDTMYRRGVEAVGTYHDRPNRRDIDYRVRKTAAGDALIALLRDEIEPSVVVRPKGGMVGCVVPAGQRTVPSKSDVPASPSSG